MKFGVWSSISTVTVFNRPLFAILLLYDYSNGFLRMRTRKTRIIKVCVVISTTLMIGLLWQYFSRQIFTAFCQEGKPFKIEDGNVLFSGTKSGNIPKQEGGQGSVSNTKSGVNTFNTADDGYRLFSNRKPVVKPFDQQNGNLYEQVSEALLGKPSGLNSPTEFSMTWRARFVHGMCQQINWNSTYINGRTPVFFFSKPTGLLACKSPKTGSTLLGALIRAINLPNEKNVSNMFQLGRNTIHDGMNELRGGLTTKLIGETTLSVMVTRDPYSRLYSAFIDKYFLLGRLGRELAAYLKHGFKEENDSYCGYDVTFQEFLDYVVYLAQNNVEMNEHMVPISQLCDVCNVRYDLICRQEHLTQATEEILKMVTNLSRDRLGAIRNSLKSQQTSLLSLVASHIFDYNYNRQDCPNKLYFSAKMWKTFQIQGLVNSELDFPEHVFAPFSFAEKEASNMTSAILQVIQSKPLTKEGRKLQRMKYLSEAYRDIRWQTIVNIQKVYQLDILLFGYSNYPPNVPMSSVRLTN